MFIHALLLNANCHFSFFNQILSKIFQTVGAPTLLMCSTSGPQRSISSCCLFSIFRTEYPLMCKVILLATIQIKKKTIDHINSLENHISLAPLI